MKHSIFGRWLRFQLRLLLLTALVGLALFLLARPAGADSPANQPAIYLHLRDAGGAPLAGERVNLQRLPEETAVDSPCTTDAAGHCLWLVGPGLYQLLFDRPLDLVSAAVLAEGGLRGYGLTGADRPVHYHFTLQRDAAGVRRIYFDLAPEAAVPVPFIPDPADWQPPLPDQEFAQTAGAPTVPIRPAGAPILVATAGVDDDPVGPGSLLLFLTLGLALGAGLHLITHYRASSMSSEPTLNPTRPSTASSATRHPLPSPHSAPPTEER